MTPDPAPVKTIRLGNRILILSGAAFSSTYFAPDRGVPLIRNRDVGSSRTELRYFGPYDKRYLVQPGDLVVRMDGEFAAARWRGHTALLNQRVARVSVVDQGVDPSFLYHAIQRPLMLIQRETAGTTVKHLSASQIAAIEVLDFPLAEQRAIAAVLDAIDEAIERTEEVIAATERLRDALLHELLTRGLPGRHSEWADVPGLGTVPACWDVVRLGEVADVQTGRAVNRKSPRNGNVAVPYLSVANVKDGYLDLNGVKTMLVSLNDLERYGLQVGDVLFTEGGDADKLGRGTVWQGEIEPCLHQNHVFAVRPHDDLLLSSFLSASASSDRGRRYFLGAAKQTTNLASINSTQLKSMPLPLPTLPEQRAIDAALGGVDGAIERAREERAGLHSLQASSADALLTGRVRVA